MSRETNDRYTFDQDTNLQDANIPVPGGMIWKTAGCCIALAARNCSVAVPAVLSGACCPSSGYATALIPI